MTEPVKHQELFFNALKPAYRQHYLEESARLGYRPLIAVDMDYVRGDAILARNESDGKQRYVIPRSAVVWTAELYKTTLITVRSWPRCLRCRKSSRWSTPLSKTRRLERSLRSFPRIERKSPSPPKARPI